MRCVLLYIMLTKCTPPSLIIELKREIFYRQLMLKFLHSHASTKLNIFIFIFKGITFLFLFFIYSFFQSAHTNI
jgi:hypothetical protein